MRIIAGQFRSRKLYAPEGLNTRPMPDRVRESVFGMLGERIKDAAVADFFAGTGSIGLEALSRGARSCVFFERDRLAADVLRRNIATLGVQDRTEIVVADALGLSAPARCPRPLDLAFFDPPYPLIEEPIGWERVKAQCAAIGQLLAPDGFLILRTPEPHFVYLPLTAADAGTGGDAGDAGDAGEATTGNAPIAVGGSTETPGSPPGAGHAKKPPIPRALRPRKYQRERKRWEEDPNAPSFQEMRRGSDAPRRTARPAPQTHSEDSEGTGDDGIRVTEQEVPRGEQVIPDHAIPGCRGPESHAYGKTVVHWYMRAAQV